MKLNSQKSAIIIFTALLFLPFIYIVTAYIESYDIISKGLEYNPNLATQIYDINGELISELFLENRSYIEIKDIPDHVKHAFIAAEDRNFYFHRGIDIYGIIRALIIDILSGEIRQGGSTITQQLVKQIYTRGKKSIKRKIVETFIAVEMEKNFRKEKILEMYLNQIYFGHGVYGINSAAKFFFNSKVNDLGIAEASMLASIPSAPNKYSPMKNPGIAFERSRFILNKMIKSGFINKEKAGQFNAFWYNYLEDIMTRYQDFSIRNRGFDKAPYFTEYIRKKLIKKYGEKRVYQKGLKVYTTLDIKCQKAAREFLLQGIERQNSIALGNNKTRLNRLERNISDKKEYNKFIEFLNKNLLNEILISSSIFGITGIDIMLESYMKRYEKLRLSSKVEGAFIALDPKTGGVTAMVGGSGFNRNNQLNRSVQSRRQPGSSFKAFVYGAGFESGKITPATEFLDVPVLFKEKNKIWAPSNYKKQFYGKILVRKAFSISLNIVSILIYEQIGGRSISRFASKLMKIPKKRFVIDGTLALGTTELTPLELATGFAVFANDGKEVIPYSIRYIVNKDNNRIFDSQIPQSNIRKKTIISRETAFLMTSILRSVVDNGTASMAVRRNAGFYLPAAGKTGTNTGFKDAWFAGFTPDLAAVVWIGCDSQNFSLGPGQSGAAAAAPVWGNFMKKVYSFRKPGKFNSMPKNVRKVTICRKTGKIPAQGCPKISEYFIRGTEPDQICSSEHDELINLFDFIRKNKKN